MTTPPPPDVIIVGGGLVGMTLALALARHEVASVVIDAADLDATLTAAFDGRASAIASASARMSPLLETLLQPGGLLLGDRAFHMPGCREISAQSGVPEGRYYVYRRFEPEVVVEAAE